MKKMIAKISGFVLTAGLVFVGEGESLAQTKTGSYWALGIGGYSVDDSRAPELYGKFGNRTTLELGGGQKELPIRYEGEFGVAVYQEYATRYALIQIPIVTVGGNIVSETELFPGWHLGIGLGAGLSSYNINVTTAYGTYDTGISGSFAQIKSILELAADITDQTRVTLQHSLIKTNFEAELSGSGSAGNVAFEFPTIQSVRLGLDVDF